MPPTAAVSNEYRDYDIEAGRRNSNNRRDDYTRQYPPSTIIQQLPYPSPEDTENSTDVDERRSRRSSRSRSRSRSSSRGPSKTLKKQLAKFFRANGRHGNGPEQSSLLHQTLKSGGTFDTQATNNTGGDGDDVYPRSQSRLSNKWGHIKQQMNPDQWMRSLESAQTLGWGTGLAADGSGEFLSREELMENAQEKIRTLGQINVWHCLVAVLIYIGISVACFSFWLEEKWTIVDSVYFAFVTFTTIGYGDLVPDTRMARLFTCVWALSGVACLGIALGVLGSELVEVAEQDKKKAKDQHKAEMIDMFNTPSDAKSNRRDDGTTSQWSDLSEKGVEDDIGLDNDEADSTGCCDSVFSKKLRRFCWLSIFVVVTLHFLALVEGWTLWSTIYYGIITASTVGYGDLSPQTQTGRLLAILYIPIAVGVMGSFLDVVANTIIARQKQGAENYWQHKELSLKDLRAMDSDGDGTVSKAEFLEFMLIATDQVDKEALDNLKDHFDRLDKDKSGSLDKADLISMAQSKLESERMPRRRR